MHQQRSSGLDAVGERTRHSTGASFALHADTPKIIDLPQDRFTIT
jgi:hypothetical protein